MGESKKQVLHEKCNALVSSRIAECRKRSEEFQNAANQETKSSAGDKYETGRAMMQLEKDKVFKQLEEVSKLKKVLDQIDPTKVCKKGELGSLVFTSQGNYYISASLGKVVSGNEEYFCLSPVAPFGKTLLDNVMGDSIVFNNQSIKIIKIE